MNIEIVRRASGTICASILGELPEWFGIQEANEAYAVLAEGPDTWLAISGEKVLGLMVLKRHQDAAIENSLLAVRPAHHRQGIGRLLLQHALPIASDEGASYLTVKTLGPSRDYEPYARTRAFYRSFGFTPVEEFETLWGPDNPCLFMVLPTPSPVSR